jgi:HEAT repeat protein
MPPLAIGDRVEALYDQGRNAIERGQYQRAVDQFNRLIDMKTNRSDAALYWKAYSEDRLGEQAKALATLAELTRQFAESRWIRDAKALEVEMRQAAGQAVPTDLQNDEELKLLALRGLMQNDPDQAMPIIEKMLTGSNTPRVKERALFVLAQSRTPRARDIMAATAKTTSNPDLQLRAINYLGMMNGPESRQVLEDVYKSSTDADVKRAVLRGLMLARDNARLLAVAKTETTPDLRRRAVDMLGAMHATTELTELYQAESSPEIRKSIVNALFAQRDAAALVSLAKAEKNPDMKREIVSRLSMIKTKEATDYLLELLK